MPRPVAPTTPTACESSTKSRWPCCLRDLDQRGQRGQIAFHAEDAIGCDEAESVARCPIGIQHLSQVVHIGVFVNLAMNDFGAAQACPVDDAGVIQPIAVNHVAVVFRPELLVDDGCKEAFVRRETG